MTEMTMVLAVLFALPMMGWAAEVDHSKMGHAAPAVQDGPWSYTSRKNPAPYKSGRWEMVPVPGYGHMFISTQGLSQELACAALANPGVMVDRATRARCGITERPKSTMVPAVQPAAPVIDHSKMKH